VTIAEINAWFDAVPLREATQLLAISFYTAWVLILAHSWFPGVKRVKFKGILLCSLLCFWLFHVFSLISLGSTTILPRHEITNILALLQMLGLICLILFSGLYVHKKVCFT
jgi:hypothetical protein